MGVLFSDAAAGALELGAFIDRLQCGGTAQQHTMCGWLRTLPVAFPEVILPLFSTMSLYYVADGPHQHLSGDGTVKAEAQC